MRKFFISLIQSRAKAVLDEFKPTIIAITGSMGKTSTKEAIKIVLEETFDVRAAKKNYNNEIGVPLTILGADVSPGKSIAGWLRLLWRSRSIKSYPKVLILEFGADHPGDITALCEFAPPKIGVVTGLSSVHAEFFDDLGALAEEKAQIIRCLPKDGLAVLNADQERVKEMASATSARSVLYGVSVSDLQARNVRIETRLDEDFEPGERFSRTTAEVALSEGYSAKLELDDSLGYAPTMSALAALAVGKHLGVPIDQMLRALKEKFRPGPGRLRPLAGIKGSLIIDDSYNAAPAAMQNGLEILRLFSPERSEDRRIAVLGQMAELGQYTEEEHRMVGLKVAECADLFIAVGGSMRTAIEAAEEAGMDPDNTEWFGSSEEAEAYLDREVQQGDIVYVKGSQSSRMERVVKGLMAEPMRAEELLVRQEAKWLK